MSTDYALLKKVSACDLFDGRLEELGVREHSDSDQTSGNTRYLTGGRNYLSVYINDDGLVSCITRHGRNAPSKILNAIAEAFDTEIVSEYEPQFWGFDTQDEWDAVWGQVARDNQESFYIDILKYLRGEPSGIIPGRIGEIMADIAKELVKKNPELLLSANMDKLLSEIELVYDRDHTVKITLTPEEVAIAEMMVTHEDDLPHA